MDATRWGRHRWDQALTNGQRLGLQCVCAQIDYWLDYVCATVVAGANFEAACNGINDYLALRTYIVGHDLTVADIALWGQLQGESNAA